MENVTEKPEKQKRNVVRSPGYPMISLDEAIDRARVLWEKDRNNTIPVEAAYKHLGYATMGGYAARIMAALKKFDLISENKSGIKLTNEAVDLFLSDPSSERYAETIRKLAVRPAIYDKILNDCNGVVPSDESLRWKLIREHAFNAKSVDDFITSFRKTMEFAGMKDANALRQEIGDSVDDAKPGMNIPMPRTERQAIDKGPSLSGHVFPIPLSKRKQAAIAFESLPVDKKDIEAIKKWLELFSDSLTEEDEN